MNGKLYIKKFIRDDGETLSFDAEEIYLTENNTLLVRSDPATTAIEFTEEDGGEMIRQRGATYSQPVSGLIVPKSTEYWALCVRLSRFFILNHTYKIVYIKRDGSMFSMNRAWINAGLQIVPVPYENYSTWTIEFRIGDNFWTEYAEDGQGKEIYSNTVELPLLTAGTGGEVWSNAIQQTLSGLGNYFAIDGTSISASINELEVRGDTSQQTSPNPDYPQDVQVVTGEQMVTVSGANLYDYTDTKSVSTGITTDSDGWITAEYNNTGGSTVYLQYFTDLLEIKNNTNYAIVIEVKNVSGNGSIDVCTSYQGQFTSSDNYLFSQLEGGKTYIRTETTKASFDDAIYSLRTVINFASGQSGSITFRFSVLEDTTVVPESFVYQPYQIQSYTINLSSIELCKLGDYQDYIYKSGDDWYVHKATGKITLDGSETWSTTQMANNWMYYTINAGMATVTSSQVPNIISNYFSVTTTDGQWTSVAGSKSVTLSNIASPSTQIRFTVGDSTNKLADFKTWLSAHNTIVYYALATPTETKITDATLRGQLNALAGAQAYSGKTVYQTDSATMPAILSVELLQSVGGGEVWDNVGAVWEEGVGGVQTINVETTQTTYPVWTVTGPCSNPTLQNDTTDTLASFDGMIASGQTLTVNFADNTAYLDSAPVAKYVSGYVSLAPGENVIGFNSDGGSTQTSTISWDNIIN